MEKKDFILASASPYRLALLEQVELCPKLVCPADIDESCLRFETPSRYVKRMALEKARRVAALHPGENVLACDTVVVVGRRILHKAGSDEEQTRVMRLVSGRASHVLSAVCLINKNGREALRFSDSRVLTRRLSEEDIRNYVATGEWKGCSGEEKEVAADGLLAIALQHEIDHLDGILYIDRISRLKRQMLLKKLQKMRAEENEE